MKKICPDCGTKLPLAMRTCDVCKFYFADFESPAPPPYEPSKDLVEKECEAGLDWYKAGMIFFHCIIFICIIAIICLLTYCMGE